MPNALKTLAIGEVSREANCKIQTIRFYEQIGLIPEPVRTQGNQRRYSPQSVKVLQFIRHARDMGFDLDSIRELLKLATQPGKTCKAADDIAKRHLLEIRNKISRLKKLEKELARVVECGAHGTIANCRVLEILADHTKCASKAH